MLKSLIRLEILKDERMGGDFLKVARRLLRNHYADGTSSAPYAAESAYRRGIDAVAVLPWRRDGEGAIEVLLRQYLRPGIDLRAQLFPPVQDQWHPVPMMWELCAGVPEPEEYSPEGFPLCGARELAEEMGLDLPPAELKPLGGGIYPSGGILTEMIHLFAAEVPADAEPGPMTGDGSAFEEAGALRWWSLDDALAACRAGEIADAKTEIALWRLRSALA